MRKKVKIIILIIIVMLLLMNTIAFFNKMLFINSEDNTILKERYELPDSSRIILVSMPRSFFRPYFTMIYWDNAIKVKTTGSISESDPVSQIVYKTIDENIFKNIWILNLFLLLIILTLIIVLIIDKIKKKYRK